jgi:hypothetical protein
MADYLIGLAPAQMHRCVVQIIRCSATLVRRPHICICEPHPALQTITIFSERTAACPVSPSLPHARSAAGSSARQERGPGCGFSGARKLPLAAATSTCNAERQAALAAFVLLLQAFDHVHVHVHVQIGAVATGSARIAGGCASADQTMDPHSVVRALRLPSRP